jgi:hypothetical protein
LSDKRREACPHLKIFTITSVYNRCDRVKMFIRTGVERHLEMKQGQPIVLERREARRGRKERERVAFADEEWPF